jgi:AGZA family xanthine/uracil permease-like MFS transporter
MEVSMEKFFKLQENNTTVRTEVIAGITTFLTMAYILVVNPMFLKEAGMDAGGVFMATAIASLIATLVMALFAKLPFALAPGMGLNAFFAFTVVLGMGASWQFALTAVFLEGIIFMILTFFNIREAIINCIPANIKKAISVGIGLFIAFIGLNNAGIVVAEHGTLVKLGAMNQPAVLLALLGLVVIGILLALKIKGALLIGIVAITLLGIPFGVTNLSGFKVFSLPSGLEKVFFQFEWGEIFSLKMLVVLVTFLFVDMFDTVGTLIGVSTKANLLDSEGKLPRAKQALFADAVGTTIGAVLGTSTVTTYVESAAGVEEGGRTGLTSLVTAGLFAVALLFSSWFLAVPNAATAPALIIVGLFMMSPIKEIDLNDYTEAIPAFLAIILMPLTYSIANGILFGILAYVILKSLTGRIKEVPVMTYVIGVLFVLYFISQYLPKAWLGIGG